MTNKVQRKHKRFGILQRKLGYEFCDHANIERALTHSSVHKNSDDDFHYERLEFLGDRVLGLVVAEALFENYPKANEGELSLRLNALVKGETLALIADKLNLHEFIRTGGDLKTLTGKRMQNVRADVLEAVIASIFLDGGLDAARAFINRFWSKLLLDEGTAQRDSKTELQEWSHANHMSTPQYCIIDRAGPDHDPVFTVSVRVNGSKKTIGVGPSKRSAERDAAHKMLLQEGVWNESGLVV